MRYKLRKAANKPGTPPLDYILTHSLSYELKGKHTDPWVHKQGKTNLTPHLTLCTHIRAHWIASWMKGGAWGDPMGLAEPPLAPLVHILHVSLLPDLPMVVAGSWSKANEPGRQFLHKTPSPPFSTQHNTTH
uniref:Uncharacterized protein n=1 Tax=Setaria italica TaxID=4555 RepID=K3XR22_SETIT